MKHHTKKKLKIRKFVRDSITAIMVAWLGLSLSVVDGVSWWLVAGVVVPGLWFALLAWANGGWEDESDVFDR
jgi:hypothetical protein